jgi:hypothetical protein
MNVSRIYEFSIRLRNVFRTFKFFLILLSCKLNTSFEYNIIGRWASYDREFGYVEYMIDSMKVYPCIYRVGLGGPINYILRNDSILYTEGNYYSAKLVWICEDEVVWKSKDYVDTLYRLPANAVNFHEIKEMGDSIIAQFKIDFIERRNRMLIQKGDTSNLSFPCFLDHVRMTRDDWIKIRKNK